MELPFSKTKIHMLHFVTIGPDTTGIPYYHKERGIPTIAASCSLLAYRWSPRFQLIASPIGWSTFQEIANALSCLGTACGFVVALFSWSLFFLACSTARLLAGWLGCFSSLCLPIAPSCSRLQVFFCLFVHANALPASLMPMCLFCFLLACRCLVLVACMALGPPRMLSYFFFACFFDLLPVLYFIASAFVDVCSLFCSLHA
jgi:hypothetical protein